MDKLATQLSNYVKPKTVFVFSKSYCPYCDRAKELLNNLGIPHKAIEVDQVPSLDSDKDFINYLHKHSGFSTYPKVYIGDKCIGGFTDLNKLYSNMKLFNLLKNEGIEWEE
jgi:glutaredoxin 3